MSISDEMAEDGIMCDSPMLAFVNLDNGKWSIAAIESGSFYWWCGSDDKWVSPRSDWWQISSTCWSHEFSTEVAQRFAKKRGWL